MVAHDGFGFGGSVKRSFSILIARKTQFLHV
jgi:hypothetical protein